MKKFLAACFVLLLVLSVPRQSLGQGAMRRIVSIQHKERRIFYKTPLIPYPYIARSHHATGTGVLRVSFDGKGQATKAEMIKSTGHASLDAASVKYAKSYWSSSPDNASVLDTVLVFQIR